MSLQHPIGPSPHKVLLFSGHMIDAPGREKPRFPAAKEPIAAAEIAKTLDHINAGRTDLAICGGACGGDLLFAEAALGRQLALELYIPFREEEFLVKSVDFADADWRSRYLAVRARRRCISRPTNSPPLQRTKIPTSATICGCWTPRCVSVPKGLTSSVYGTVKVATVRAERSTSCKRFKTKAGGRIG